MASSSFHRRELSLRQVNIPAQDHTVAEPQLLLLQCHIKTKDVELGKNCPGRADKETKPQPLSGLKLNGTTPCLGSQIKEL